MQLVPEQQSRKIAIFHYTNKPTIKNDYRKKRQLLYLMIYLICNFAVHIAHTVAPKPKMPENCKLSQKQ